MPAKLTLTQLEASTQHGLTLLRKDMEIFQREIGQLELSNIRERIVALETTLAEVKRKKEDNEKRNLQFLYIFIGAVFTILIQLLIAWTKK